MSYNPQRNYNGSCIDQVQQNIRSHQIDGSRQCGLTGQFEAPIQDIDRPMRKTLAKAGHSLKRRMMDQIFSNERVPISIIRWVDHNPHFGVGIDMEPTGVFEYCPVRNREIEVHSMYVYPDIGWTAEDGLHLIHVFTVAEFFSAAPNLEPCYLAQTGTCEEWGCSLKWVKENYQSDGSHVVSIRAFSHAEYVFKEENL